MYFRTSRRKADISDRVRVDIDTLTRFGKMKFNKFLHNNKI